MRLYEPPPTTECPAERFSGEVRVDAIAGGDQPPMVIGGIVRFAAGAHTAWHVHARGQTLHILDGIAIVHSRDGETIIARPGETVHTPAGQWHWHGATPDEPMTHLALSDTVPHGDGPPVTWAEHVTERDYDAAVRAAEKE
ncbi:cupin domain-containing protein [Microbacterium sp. NPDC056052]|uniref:cupin domain-containing protein n=1 Tax=Microbacterium sp. NPDC056052 TaxID=3345695 RepID=UPI0035DCC967